MSGPQVVMATKVIGTLFAAKTAMEGVRDGNVMKAAIGGLGAYLGMSNLATSGTLASTGSETVAYDAATDAQANLMDEGLDDVATSQISEPVAAGVDLTLGGGVDLTLGGGGSGVLSPESSDTYLDGILDRPDIVTNSAPAEPGILDSLKEYLPALLFGGQAIGGYVTQRNAEDKLNFDRKKYADTVRRSNEVPTLRYGAKR